MFKIVLAPHNDDECLFCAYTIIREKPLVIVVTDGFNQTIYGVKTDWLERRRESIRAMGILGASVMFMAIRDIDLTEDLFYERLKYLNPDKVYAPALEGGHQAHDIVSRVAQRLFKDVTYYYTYSRQELFAKGKIEVIPTQEEIELKNKALDEYKTQLNMKEPHFEMVKGKSEWLC